ncbi:AmiS/UreI family transporter [Brevibacillus ginsengisoli]|uniref:AmiS/UreI family transporter n=1 Tax=Brevibacillus ginsengisoli TaxID=363854 RepID=UPI003CF14377
MGYVGLLLSGATLFLNSLMLQGKAEGKSVAVFNLFVGALQVIFPFYMIVTSDMSNWVLYQDAAVFLFGLTYLYVGVTFGKGLNGTGLGWFSLWVSIIAIVYTVVSIVHFHNIVDALTWLMWAYLWFLFYLLNVPEMDIARYVGKVAMVQSWVTLTIPALFYLTGVGGTPMVNQMWIAVCSFSLLYFVVSAIQLKVWRKDEAFTKRKIV